MMHQVSYNYSNPPLGGVITEIYPVAGIIESDDGQRYIFPLTDINNDNLTLVDQDPQIWDEVVFFAERRDIDRTDFRFKEELVENANLVQLCWGVQLSVSKRTKVIVEKLESSPI